MRTDVIDPHDDELFREFHTAFWRAEKEDGRPWNPMWSYEEMSGIFREPTADRRMVGVATRDDDGHVLGAGFLSLSLLDNLTTAHVFVAVEPALRGQGYGAAVMERIVEVAREDGRHQLLADTAVEFAQRDTSPVLEWVRRQGFEQVNTEVHRMLELPVAATRLDELEAEVTVRAGGYDVQVHSAGLPDELVASWCELNNLFMLEAPMGDVDVEAGRITPEAQREREAVSARIGRTVYSAVAVRDGRVVAHSDLSVTRGADEAYQWGTLVHPDHRGHRLGLAVKVANLRALAAGHPGVRTISTTNAETNAWMVAVNDRIGFEPVAVVPVFKRLL